MANKQNFKKLYHEIKTDHLKALQKIELFEKRFGKHPETILETINEQSRIIVQLKQELNQYNNSNTPPSHKAYFQNMKRKNPKKSGPKKGHAGTTNKPKPTQTKKHTLDKCPNCNGNHLTQNRVYIRIITDTPPPPPPITTRHIIYVYNCNGCGMEVTPESGLPKEGSYGMNIIKNVIACFANRMPYRMIADNLGNNGVSISASTVYGICRNVGKRLEEPAGKILESLRSAKIVHADETSLSLNGKNVWIWGYHDPKALNTFYAIRHKRDKSVPRDILQGWNGMLVCDGWQSYNGFNIQRCWAHILREIKHLDERYETEQTRHVRERMYGIYDLACKCTSDVKKMRQSLLRRVMYLVDMYRDDPILGGYMTKLARAGKDMFKFVGRRDIPSTNNAAERILREMVVQRKIRGCIRAESSMEWMGNLFTCMMTWKNTGVPLSEVANYV